MSDVVIIGAGPAGLTLGSYLADAGISTLVLEKAHHPRPHVGESLMPATVRIFQEIGFLPLLEQGHFPRSEGVVYHTGDGALPLSYAEFPQEGVEQSHTYHVDRAKFDLLLMKHAQSRGCRIAQGVGVHEVVFAGERACGVRAVVGDVEVEIPAKIVVDAGGRRTLLGRQLGIREAHPVLDRFALHAWYQGVDRGPARRSNYTQVHLLPGVDGWAWQAPIDGSITSVGVVADKEAYNESGLDAEGFVDYVLSESPSLAASCHGAWRINDLKGEVNYSYALERVCGDGWVAVGDAAAFLDPIFSSGVSVAMHSAREVAGRIATALEGGDVGREVFYPYEEQLARSTTIFDLFVQLFYRRPEALIDLAGTEHREGVLRLLQGDLPRDAGPTLEAMRRTVERLDASA